MATIVWGCVCGSTDPPRAWWLQRHGDLSVVVLPLPHPLDKGAHVGARWLTHCVGLEHSADSLLAWLGIYHAGLRTQWLATDQLARVSARPNWVGSSMDFFYFFLTPVAGAQMSPP
jgi:hypothetical protein